MSRRFLKTDDGVILAIGHVVSADYTGIDDLRLVVTDCVNRTHTITGIDALEAVMLLRPDVLEGKRLRWHKHAWAAHNLLGHPLLQLAAWAKQYQLGFWIHDKTVPKPKE